MKITAIVIAKNEEQKISDCLKSISFCDQIILVDNGSIDKTIEIAKKHKTVIFPSNAKSFAELRNFGLKKSTGDWILYLDADERITPSLKEEILQQVGMENKYSAFKIKRKNIYFNTVTWPHIEKLERLFKKDALSEWYGDLHESPRVKGEIGELNNPMVHYTHDDLSSMTAKTNKWSDIEADLRFKSNHPQMTWWRFPRVMLTAFIDSYIDQGGWKVGTPGLVESLFQSYSIFITYAKLWELQNQKK